MPEIRPQLGFQTMALSTSADIAILGGAAGCGKTFTLLLESLRNTKNGGYGGIIFRKNTTHISVEGGLWDTSMKLYPYVGGKPVSSRYQWHFPSGAKMSFKHIESDAELINWQGAQIPFIGFDELTHFTEATFIYMGSRNRSDSGVRGYIRATCNPDPASWVARLIKWWIDPITGFPIPERAGVIRYMARFADVWLWGDDLNEVYLQAPDYFDKQLAENKEYTLRDLIKTFTFIPGKLADNKILTRNDPGYLGSLMALSEAERSQLLDGNWKATVDGLRLYDMVALDNLFDNLYSSKEARPLKCITCDAARFGRDFCVIKVWRGWDVIHISIFKKSDAHDIVREIERLRGKFGILKTDVIVDQDGVGGDTVKIGRYVGFRGGDPAVIDPNDRKKERYANFKTQCYYRFAIRVNENQVRYLLTNDTCRIWEDGSLNGTYGTKIKVNGQMTDVRELIKEDYLAIKRARTDDEGKLCINPKEEQKLILGRSPDFADTGMMREAFELRERQGSINRAA